MSKYKSFVYDLSEAIEIERKEPPICNKTPNSISTRGSEEYYIFRFNDFMDRHKDCACLPPDYYYGNLREESVINRHIAEVEQKTYENFPVFPVVSQLFGGKFWRLVEAYRMLRNISNNRELWLGLERELARRQRQVPAYSKNGEELFPKILESYGYKYCVAFGILLRPKLSPQGQQWINRTLVYLQNFMEQGLINRNWLSSNDRFNRHHNLYEDEGREAFYSDIELDNRRFRAFAFATHPDAYLEAELETLPRLDLIRIVITPDFEEWKELDTREQALQVMPDVMRGQFQKLIEEIRTGEGRRQVVEDAIELLRAVNRWIR